MSEFRQTLNRTLTALDELTDVEEVPLSDSLDGDTEFVEGYTWLLLMLRQSFLTPRAPSEDWLHSSMFQSTCTIGGKVCSFIIDSGSYENVISEHALEKLGLSAEAHPKPYKLAWLNRHTDVLVTRRALVTLSVGPTYMLLIFIAMWHLWMLVIYYWGIHDNLIERLFMTVGPIPIRFNFMAKKLSPGRVKKPPSPEANVSILSRASFESAMLELGIVYLLLATVPTVVSEPPSTVMKLVDEFQDVFPCDIPNGLPPLRDIQHCIDLVEALLSMGHIRESLSPCAVPALLTPEKDDSWRMCVDSQAINKITLRYYFPIPRLDDLLDQLHGASCFTKIDLKSAIIRSVFVRGMNIILLLKRERGCLSGRSCPSASQMLLAPVLCIMNQTLRPFIDGSAVDSTKIEAIANWTISQTILEVQSLHVLASFYR